jgi:hypothetical protein
MAVVRVNQPGLSTTSPGYISSITVYTGGSATVLAPSTTAATYGEITCEALAATQLTQVDRRFVLVTG